MAVKVIDKQTQQEVDVGSAEAQKGFLQGRYVMPDGQVRVARGNTTGTVHASELQASLANGWNLVDDEEAASRRLSPVMIGTA